MKKLLCLALACALTACALSGCGAMRRSDADETGEPERQTAAVNFEPETTALVGSHGETDQSAALLEAQPTLEPVETIANEDDAEAEADGGAPEGSGDAEDEALETMTDAFDTYDDTGEEDGGIGDAAPEDDESYKLVALNDNSLGFTFKYPSTWENVPGIHTVCYREVVEEGDFPARVAVTRKKLVHTPDRAALIKELTAYLKVIYRQYDASTFQVGTPRTNGTFMGKTALSNTYLAYAGEHEVKGIIIGCAVGKTLYVYHFCATYDDYKTMNKMMRAMAQSIKLND